MTTKEDFNIRKIKQSLQSQVGCLDKIAVLSKTNRQELIMNTTTNDAHHELIDVTNFTVTIEEINSCQKCGHGHSFRPSLGDVRTSIDVIPLPSLEQEKADI